jgi:hypothetical protein
MSTKSWLWSVLNLKSRVNLLATEQFLTWRKHCSIISGVQLQKVLSSFLVGDYAPLETDEVKDCYLVFYHFLLNKFTEPGSYFVSVSVGLLGYGLQVSSQYLQNLIGMLLRL